MYVKAYTSGDEEDILILFQEVFGKPMDMQFWKWRYKENPYGEGIIRLMYEKDKLIGHYAVIPLPLWLKGRIENAAFSMTTMTHPNYGRQGIFTRLASEVYSTCNSLGIKIVFGFPNKNSYYGLTNRLDWLGLGQIQYWEKKGYLDLDYLREDFYCNEISYFRDKSDILWEELKWNCSVIVPRNSKFLNWRYIENPWNEYVIYAVEDKKEAFQGYIVLKIFQSELDDVGQIVDIFVVPNSNAIVALIKKAFEFFRNNNVSVITIWNSELNHINKVLLKLGFLRKKWVGFDSKEWPTYFGIKIINYSDQKIEITKMLDNWYLMMGDSDVF